MTTLLDTHALISCVDDPNRLSAAQRRTIRKASRAAELWVSQITFWEVASIVERRRLRLALAIDE